MIAKRCAIWPWLATVKVTFPDFCEATLERIQMSPIVTLTPAALVAVGPDEGALAAAPPAAIEDIEDVPASIMLGSTGCEEPPVGVGGAPSGDGAPGVCSIPAAPLVMSPKSCVTNG